VIGYIGGVEVELIGYGTNIIGKADHISRSTRPLLHQYTRSLPDRFSSAWLLDRYSTFLTVKNYRVGSPVDADHPDHNLLDRFPIA